LVVPLLGLFFLVYPILVVLGSEPTPTQTFIALGGAALFACVFLWLMLLHEPLQLVLAEPSRVLKYRATIAFLAVLAGVLSLILGVEWRMLFIYPINVAAGIMLLRKDAYLAIAGIVVVTLIFGSPWGWHGWWSRPSRLASGPLPSLARSPRSQSCVPRGRSLPGWPWRGHASGR
jgi:hypothetical protein